MTEIHAHRGVVYRTSFLSTARASQRPARTGAAVWSADGDRLSDRGVAGEVIDARFVSDGTCGGPARRDAPLLAPVGRRERGRAARDGRGRLSLGLSTDGSRLLVGTLGGGVTLFDVSAAPNRVASLDGHGEEITRLRLLPDGRAIASASRDNHARLWDARGLPPRAPRARVVGQRRRVVADGALPRDGREDGAVKLWQPADGRVVTTWRSTAGAARSLAWSADGRFAVGTERGAVDVWDVRARTKLRIAGERPRRGGDAAGVRPRPPAPLDGGRRRPRALLGRDGRRSRRSARPTGDGHTGAITALPARAESASACSRAASTAPPLLEHLQRPPDRGAPRARRARARRRPQRRRLRAVTAGDDGPRGSSTRTPAT